MTPDQIVFALRRGKRIDPTPAEVAEALPLLRREAVRLEGLGYDRDIRDITGFIARMGGE